MKKILFLFLCGFLFLSIHNIHYSLFAQNESGVRPIPVRALKAVGFYYDSTNSMFQIQYPIIRSIPPLSVSMPYEVLISYIYLDSLLRFATKRQLDSLISTWTCINDTLAGAIKYLFIINDYNPIIFNQYIDETSHYRKPSNTSNNIRVTYTDGYIPDTTQPLISYGKYKATLYDFYINIINKLCEFLDPAERNSIFSLLYSDYIFRIRVINIDSTLNKLAPVGFENDLRYKVTAFVIDTIKGKIFKTIPQNNIHLKKTNNKLNDENFPIVEFQYLRRNYQLPPILEYGDNTSDLIEDTAFVVNFNEFTMHEGQEAIVFIRHKNHLMDLENDYYDLGLEPSCSYNALFIDSNNNVRDLNKFWTQNIITPYSNWKQKVNELINKILNMNY